MSRAFLTLAILLTATGVMIFPGCGDNQEETSTADLPGPDITVLDRPDVSGWIEIALADETPLMAEAGSGSTWLLFRGGNLLRFNEADGWRAFSVENAVEVQDMRVSGDVPILLTSSSLITLSTDAGEATTKELPDGFVPVLMGCSAGTVALVDRTGDIAIATEEGFDLFAADDNLFPVGNLVKLGPDWVFPLEGGGLAFFDPSADLWQFETSPEAEVLVASDGGLFLGAAGEVLTRTEPSVWTHWADGILYPSGLLLADQGICRIHDTGTILAEKPSFQPLILLSSGSGEPYWAMDQLGLAAYAEIGSVQATLSFCDAERVSCSLAGQAPASQGSTESVGDMLLSGSGAFRIYESVSMRPDPFTEFSAVSHDIRRSVEELSIEELRLVGITLDPVGGDKAMVEDDLGVPYILYEGTQLRNSTRISEITSNEVIVIQDVIVDYTATGGGVTRIPTIFSMRLHEEGGL
jgi:hypothetical protein